MDFMDSTSFNRRTPPGRRTASSQEMAMANFSAPTSNRRRQGGIDTARHTRYEPPQQVLDRYIPGKADPMRVLEVLIELFNAQHTALKKTVSHKTRQERADFLRRFFRDLRLKAGFKTLPDPRNLGQKHIQAMVTVWQRERLAPATIQTYLSFLRGLALWLGKPGFIRKPDHYGLTLAEYQRHEHAQHDKSWSAAGVDIDAVIGRVCAYDPYVGASLRLIRTMGLRRKEAVMLRPHGCVVAFAATGLPVEQRQADEYVWIQQGAKGGRPRFVPLDSLQRIEALQFAQSVAQGPNAHMGNPDRGLVENLRRFDYVMARFGITSKELGVTAHGLRHQALIEHYIEQTGGVAPPVRGGEAESELDAVARQSTSHLAGHHRTRASGAYLGQSAVMRSKGRKTPSAGASDATVSALPQKSST
ncbi:integrase domain-containing protein [Alicycliphilus denitrificans]|nr:integrase domain-containing protein [Alicycliphilus denitrificans]